MNPKIEFTKKELNLVAKNRGLKKLKICLLKSC